MLSLKTIALTTFTLASVGFLASPYASTIASQASGETAMPTVTNAATAKEVIPIGFGSDTNETKSLPGVVQTNCVILIPNWYHRSQSPVQKR
jgi:hypothetical protein